jgi:uncharacterized NAD-dependent epimerase/dehydratase family protein
MSFEPTGLLIGIAPAGGLIPGEWRSIILEFLAAGCEVVSGLHEFLGDDAAFSEAARLSRTRVVDLRRPPRASVGCGRALQHRGLRVLTVGTDECIGKMTAALEIAQGAAARGWDARFIATGQTGIAVSGYGVAIDAVVSDFLAGAVEQLILENQERQLLVIEGQGAITSPSFSGVTLGLLHGCLPQALVLCHDLTRTHSRGTSFPLPSVRLAIDLYEALARAIAPCRTVAICLNTSALHEDEAQSAIRQLGNEVNLPVSDPLRFGTDAILDELSRMQARRD